MPWVNHIANPGGEYQSGGSVVFWRANSSVVTQATSPVLDGTASVQVVADAAGDGVAVPFVWPGVDGGRVFWQAYIYQGTVPGGVATQVTIRDRTNTSIAGIATPSTSATAAWTRVFGTATPTTPLVAGSAYHLYIRSGGAGTVYIDRAAVWQGGRDDALAWAAQLPLFVVEIAPGYGASDYFAGTSPLVDGAGGSATMHRVGTPWTDVTWRVRRGAYRGGRTAETEQTNAATLGLTLDNRDGALDPTTGTMGSVGMPIRVRVADPSTGKLGFLFAGQAWTIRPQRSGPYDQVVEVGAVDRFKTVAMQTWRPTGAWGVSQERADAHLLAMFTDIGATRLCGQGTADTVVMPASVAETYNVLDHAQTIARSDGGRLADHPYYGIFLEGRRVRFAVAGTIATFGTAAGEVPYSQVEPAADDSYLWNDWTVTGNGGSASANYIDATSGTRYGYRSQSVDTRIGSADAAQVSDAAAFYAGMFAYPRVRIPSVEPNLAALGTAAPWLAIMGAHHSSIVNITAAIDSGGSAFVIKRPVIGSSGGTATHLVWPEGCAVEWQPGAVRVRLDVSPAQDGTAVLRWWRLGEGQLDSTTRLAW